jgi:hypothetical protein
MADKPEFVDLIKERTRQHWRRPAKPADPEPSGSRARLQPFNLDDEELAAVNKPEFVDLIKARTPQHFRRPGKVVAEPEPVEEKRLSNWPPVRMEQWRLVNLTPWKMKLKSWKFKDWV